MRQISCWSLSVYTLVAGLYQSSSYGMQDKEPASYPQYPYPLVQERLYDLYHMPSI